MASRTLPGGLALQGFWPYGEDGYNTGMDQNLLKLSSLVQMSVISRATALPGSPTQGDIYIIPVGEDDADSIAIRDNGTWTIVAPQPGWRAWVANEEIYVHWDGSAWVEDVVTGGADDVFDSAAALQGTTFLTPPGSVVINAPGGPFGFGNVALEPTHGGKIQSTDGSWFELLTPGVTEALVGSSAAMNTFIGEMLTRPTTYGRIVNPAGGIRISDYATTTGASVDQLAVLQAAVTRLNTGSAYSVLDGEGRTFSISAPLEIDDNSGLFPKPKIITNLTLAPTADFPAGEPLIKFRRTTASGPLQQWELDHVLLKCGAAANGILVEPSYNTVRFAFCHVSDPAGKPTGTAEEKTAYGIRCLTAGGNTRVEFCDIRKSSEAAVTPSSRTMIGLWLAPDSNDGKIIGNRITYARTGIRGNINSFTIIANHIWQGPTGTGPFSDYTETFLISGRSHNLVIGNYIDNGRFVLEEGLDTGVSDEYMGYGQWIGNIFTVAENYENYNFMLLRPKGAARKIRDMIVMGNQIRSLGGVNQTVKKPFGVDTTSGNIDTSYSVGNCIKDNNFRVKVVPQETEIERHITLGGGVTAWGLDFTGFTPFGLRMENPRSGPGIRYNAAPSSDVKWSYERTGNYTGTLRITPAAAGHAVLVMTCNSGSIYDTPLSGF